MRLNRLAVTDYRNLSAAVLEPAPQLTVLCGANGQGKTNLLEAVWLLTGGKSFRGAKDAELIRRGADLAVLDAPPGCRVAALFFQPGGCGCHAGFDCPAAFPAQLKVTTSSRGAAAGSTLMAVSTGPTESGVWPL